MWYWSWTRQEGGGGAEPTSKISLRYMTAALASIHATCFSSIDALCFPHCLRAEGSTLAPGKHVRAVKIARHLQMQAEKGSALSASLSVCVCAQWLFILEGIPAVFLGVGILLYLAKSPQEAAFLRPEEKAWLAKRCANHPLPFQKSTWSYTSPRC